MTALSPRTEPFEAADAVRPIDELQPRRRAVVHGVVSEVVLRRWVGGPVAEVTIEDGSGSVTLAFLGRRKSPAFVGEAIRAAGMFQIKHGRLMALNPQIWVDGFEPLLSP